MRWIAMLGFWAVCTTVQAASSLGLSVSPISVTLDAARTATAVTLTNHTADSKVVQATVLAWSKENGEDRFAPAPEMLVTPAIFRLTPEGKQVVRVGVKNKVNASTTSEKTYRLFLEEVPEQGNETVSAVAPMMGLRLMLRFGIPVFIRPLSPKPEAMSWSLSHAADGTWALSVRNTGNEHLRLSEVQLQTGDQKLAVPNFAYVFAGETYSWILRSEASWPSGEIHITARSDAGALRATLPPASP